MFPSTNISAIALDLGTTSIKAGLLDQHGELVLIRARHAPKIDEDGGHYESDALAYAETAEQLLNECIALAGGARHWVCAASVRHSWSGNNPPANPSPR